MRYLTLIPDYNQSCLKDDFNGNVEIEDLNLPFDFVTKLNEWHLAYRKIIPLDEEQRQKVTDCIDLLDERGIEFAHQLSTLVTGGAKVKYYSEGKLKYLIS